MNGGSVSLTPRKNIIRQPRNWIRATSASFQLLADTLQTVRRFDEARTVLDRVLEISPGNEAALAAKAGIFQGQGRLKEAAEVLAKIPANSQDEAVNIQRVCSTLR